MVWTGNEKRLYMGKRAIAMDMQGGEYERELGVGYH